MTLIERLKKWLFKKTEKRQKEQTKIKPIATIESKPESEDEYIECVVCGRKIKKSEAFDEEYCWECWEDQLTEEDEWI
jgi:hypothetical protein